MKSDQRNIVLILLLWTFLIHTGCTRYARPISEEKRPRLSIINEDKTETVFYLTQPAFRQKFPIAVVCEGSSNKDDLQSAWGLYQAMKKDLDDLGAAILIIEKQGIDGNKVDKERFFANYTRSRRFHDHVQVIDYLFKNPPAGFDGRLIFIGASEGGPLVNQLSLHYPQTIATINWSGAGDWPWPDELWAWGEQMRKEHPIIAGLFGWWQNTPTTREKFDALMKETTRDPSDQRWFLGMTYRYHADAISAPKFDYKKIRAPLLVVCGTKDSLIASCDAFIDKAKAASAPVVYWRIEGMEHRISQNKQNLISRSFEWLRQWM